MADVGRPTIMDDLTVQKLEEAFANGASDIQACFLANISKQTLYTYQEKHPEFVDRKEALKDMIKYQSKLNIKDKILDGDIDTSKWYLERKDKDFKSKSESKIEVNELPTALKLTLNKNGEGDGNQADTKTGTSLDEARR